MVNTQGLSAGNVSWARWSQVLLPVCAARGGKNKSQKTTDRKRAKHSIYRAATEKLNFVLFPKIPCLLPKITLFSDQKVPPNLRKPRYFPVDYYPSLNAPFSKKT